MNKTAHAAAFQQKKIKIGKKYIRAYLIRILEKNLIILIGTKGYLACGYLDLAVAEKFNEAAIQVTGVSTIKDVLEAKVNEASPAAIKLGIFKGQPVKTALKFIA